MSAAYADYGSKPMSSIASSSYKPEEHTLMNKGDTYFQGARRCRAMTRKRSARYDIGCPRLLDWCRSLADTAPAFFWTLGTTHKHAKDYRQEGKVLTMSLRCVHWPPQVRCVDRVSLSHGSNLGVRKLFKSSAHPAGCSFTSYKTNLLFASIQLGSLAFIGRFSNCRKI